MFLDGADVTKEIRTERVSQMASIVSTLPDVRRLLVAQQQKLAHTSSGAVLDGRDIGTVVFPDADIKFFLVASAETRARRRFEEDRVKFQNANYEDTLADILARDERDTARVASPLVKAADAIQIDSSDLTIDEVLARMLSIVRAKAQPATHG